jgi:hypothetical protein
MASMRSCARRSAAAHAGCDWRQITDALDELAMLVNTSQRKALNPLQLHLVVRCAYWAATYYLKVQLAWRS